MVLRRPTLIINSGSIMCGIVGILSLNGSRVKDLERKISGMKKLIAHRGPDGDGTWTSPDGNIGLGHQRLSIIDVGPTGAQPMIGENETVICHNGEIYNYVELREQFSPSWSFKSSSDTETILAAYEHYGDDCVDHLRGMFAVVLWDAKKQRLFCARDRFGIKPFYYAVVDGLFIFASEAKALLPFLKNIETDPTALSQYLTFQYTIGDNTLFKGIKELRPGHTLVAENGQIKIKRYWDVHYEIQYGRDPEQLYEELRALLEDSIKLHMRSDVPVGCYLSGGIDSSLTTMLSKDHPQAAQKSFHGKFTSHSGYDESSYALDVARQCGSDLQQIDITADDFNNNIRNVIYHLDFPVAGPGSFPQYMVAGLTSQHVKTVLGGQGGDEIFGGYARYLIAYFEQSINAAIEGTYKNGNFIVTPESIIPNLGVLREYKPLIKNFWKEGLFEQLDARYFRLIDRSSDMHDEIDWSGLEREKVFEDFQQIFNNTRNVRKESYFDSMTHFDFKCQLPALLQVEDRMSMAHGIESRLPLLDHPLIEFLATVPADVKFSGGRMKHMIKEAYSDLIPPAVLDRRDKMGFPVPLKEWFGGELSKMIEDIFHNQKQANRPYINSDAILKNLGEEGRYSRKIWGLLSLEIWHQTFHDKAENYRKAIL
jgi:asparagine synthase (glutamine-hydrolysing)